MYRNCFDLRSLTPSFPSILLDDTLYRLHVLYVRGVGGALVGHSLSLGEGSYCTYDVGGEHLLSVDGDGSVVPRGGARGKALGGAHAEAVLAEAVLADDRGEVPVSLAEGEGEWRGGEQRGGEGLAVGKSIGIAVRTKPCPVYSASADLRQN